LIKSGLFFTEIWQYNNLKMTVIPSAILNILSLKFVALDRNYSRVLRHCTKFCENWAIAAELWPKTMFSNMASVHRLEIKNLNFV